MPSRYRHDRARLKAEIVARVAAGETIKVVCAESGWPAPMTVRTWARMDPLFGADLAAAARRGAWRRLWTYDEAKAAALLARARAGESLRSLWGQPGLPTRGQYFRWKASQPEFAEATFALLQRRDARIGERGRARRRDFNQELADRIVARLWATYPAALRLEDLLKADPALPCWETLMRWRRQQPEFDRVMRTVLAARRRRVRPVPDFVVEEVSDHIALGGSFFSYSRQPGGPSRGALRRWMRDPAFAEAVAGACEVREDFLWDQVAEVAETVPPGPIREMDRAIGPLKRRIVTLRNRPRKPLGVTPRRKPG
ncbi:MAG: hypothetical protein JSR98_07290 [Proteobacteria bacterium]|nr:hypothetical protein [Pseudomonadota bacterium]